MDPQGCFLLLEHVCLGPQPSSPIFECIATVKRLDESPVAKQTNKTWGGNFHTVGLYF